MLYLQWLPEDPLHDPLTPSELYALRKSNATLRSRMSTLEAFQDPEALRRLIEELVPKGGCGR